MRLALLFRGLLVLWLLASATGAAAGDVRISADDSYALSKSFHYLEDPGGKLTLDDILKPEKQASFKALQQAGSGANFGARRSAASNVAAEPEAAALAPCW